LCARREESDRRRGEEEMVGRCAAVVVEVGGSVRGRGCGGMDGMEREGNVEIRYRRCLIECPHSI